ncbi:NUDIX domain-containing protein, partial [Patescibacteria group bacterium]|nr:NUDIX domain-containing protein [Patescibacteria group bacterium]
IQKNGKILMGKRGNVFGKGTWALVGGHLEVNEKIEDCAIRELDEEVGIIPTEKRLLGVVNDIPDVPGQDKHYIRFVYLISRFEGEVQNKEPEKCEGWEWFDKNKLPEPIFVGHIKVLKFFLNKGDKFFLE